MAERPYGSWTRRDRKKRYFRRRRQVGRGTLALVGMALILLSVGLVFADVRGTGDSTAAVPKDRMMKLSVPSMERVRNVPVYDAPVKEEAGLRGGTFHVEGTGFPWQREANVYIAGHRLGYPRTKSFLVFWDLNKLRDGSRVVLTDSEGRRYVYGVFDRFVVGPNRVSVKKPVAGKNIVSLQTCTLPDYSERLIVRAELVKVVEPSAPQASTE